MDFSKRSVHAHVCVDSFEAEAQDPPPQKRASGLSHPPATSNERYRKMISGYRIKFMDTTPVAQSLRDHLIAVCMAYGGPGSSG
jgi:hypothetical protein